MYVGRTFSEFSGTTLIKMFVAMLHYVSLYENKICLDKLKFHVSGVQLNSMLPCRKYKSVGFCSSVAVYVRLVIRRW